MKNITIQILIFLFSFVLICNSPVWANALKETFQTATLAFSKGDYNKAIKLYEECLKIYPEFSQAYYYLALSKKANGAHLHEVKKLLLKAIELDPQYVDAYDHLAKISYELGEFEAALNYGQKAVELKPDLFNGHLTLGWIYLLGFSKPQEAIFHFEKALAVKDIAYGYFGLGMAYFMDGQRTKVFEAVTALRQMDQEGFAVKLEDMVRENKYLPPKNLGPLIKKRAKQTRNFFEDEEQFFEQREGGAYDHLKVRLKSQDFNDPEESYSSPQEAQTGLQRIEELQQRGLSLDE